MTIRLTIAFLFLLLCPFAQAQSAYEIAFCGDYDDSVSLNPSLHWYVCHTDDEERRQQFVPLNLRTDIVQTYNDTTHIYTLSLDSTFNKKGYMLIGSTDTMDTVEWYYEGGPSPLDLMPLGYTFAIYPQGLWGVSPDIHCYTTGKIVRADIYPRLKDFDLQVNCYFSIFMRYEYLRQSDTKYCKSFTQSLKKPILRYLKSQDANTDFTYSRYLVFKGFIDRDYYRDFIVEFNGYYFLFLTSGHNFKKHQVVHLEKVWKNTRHFYEF